MTHRAPRRSSPEEHGALEAWIRAASDVIDVLAGARELREAGRGILRALGERLGCESAVLWLVSRTGETLEGARVWKREAHVAGPFDGEPEPLRMPLRDSAARRAWTMKRPIWTQDLDVHGATSATGPGLALPLLYGDAFFGVVDLYASKPLQAGEVERVAAESVGRQIGQFAAREDAFRELARSRRTLADLFENAPVGVQVLDRDGRVLRANGAELAMLGYAREECTGRPWREFFVDPAAADAMLETLGRGESLVGAEARVRCNGGAVKWVRLDANSVREEGGTVNFRVFTRDVTARKEAEITLRASEERYRRLLDGARDYAIHALDAEGRVTGWNSAAMRLFGYAANEVMGLDFLRTFTPEDLADGVPARALRVAREEGEYRHEGSRVRREGARFDAEVVYTALRDAAGTLEGFSQLTRDVTQRRWLDALHRKSGELEAANRAVMEESRRNLEILRAAADAMDDPVAAVEAACARLADRRDEASGPDLDLLAGALGRLRDAVQRLDDIALGAAGAGSEAPERIDLLRVATETRDMLREAAVERRVRVDLDVDPSLDGIVSDPVRLRQVVYNFLSNAIRYSRERGRVAVRLLPEGDLQYRVEVEDSGIGIPADDLPRLFDGPARTSGDEASPRGLGLVATKRVVEEQGGRVGAVSTLGRGSVFFAVLPRVPTPRRAAAADGDRDAGPTRRALVASEEPSVRASLSWTLGHAGYEVTVAARTNDAFEVLREERFDAVAIDVLPVVEGGMGAAEFAACIRSAGANRDLGHLVVALGGAETGAAGLVVSDVVVEPPAADRLFATLERLAVPRGEGGSVLVVGGDLAALEETARTLRLLGYRALVEPDGHSGLKTFAEATPDAVVLSLALPTMDAFSFLLHLRQMPLRADVPVVLSVPDALREADRARLHEAVAEAARTRQWARTLRPSAGPLTPGRAQHEGA